MQMFNIGALLASTLSMPSLAPLYPAGKHHSGSTRYPAGHKPSRNHYWPHQSDREINRRLRQHARDDLNQKERALLAGSPHDRISRRGRPVA